MRSAHGRQTDLPCFSTAAQCRQDLQKKHAGGEQSVEN
jgi:hypothetical protein